MSYEEYINIYENKEYPKLDFSEKKYKNILFFNKIKFKIIKI